ncbi:MAG: ROK family protein [Acidobacteriota bacterium]
MQAHPFVLTYDVGGSHINAGLCRLSDLQILRMAGADHKSIDTFEGFVDLLHRLGVEAAAGEADLAGASLAVPGPFDLIAGVSEMEHKLTYLKGKSLRNALAARFGWATDRLRFLNDAAAYVLGEVGAGSLKGARRAVGLTLGTGVGCAFVVEGRAVVTGPGVPAGGEIWNYPYRGGIVEDLISTRRIKADYAGLAGTEREVAEIASRASSDPHARRVFEDFGLRLGEVLRNVIAPFQPQLVMIGGGISRSAQLFLPFTEEHLHGLSFRVVTSALLDRAPLAGAGQFWREESTGTESAGGAA